MNTRPHVQSKDCWCNPTVETVEGQEIYLHDAPALGDPPVMDREQIRAEARAGKDGWWKPIMDEFELLPSEAGSIARQATAMALMVAWLRDNAAEGVPRVEPRMGSVEGVAKELQKEIFRMADHVLDALDLRRSSQYSSGEGAVSHPAGGRSDDQGRGVKAPTPAPSDAAVDDIIQAIIEDANSSDHEDRVAARKSIRQLVEGWQRQGKLTDEWAERAFAAEAERDLARMYEKHNAVKIIALRGAVNRYLRFLRTDQHQNDDDSLLSLLDDIYEAMGRESQVPAPVVTELPDMCGGGPEGNDGPPGAGNV